MHLPWSKRSRRERRFHRQLLPHADALHHFALRLSHNPSDAEDLVQETLLKAFDALDRVPDGSNYKGWLFTILRNTFLSRMRRSGRVEYTDTPPERAEVDGTPEPGEVHKDRFDDIVYQALLALPEVQRSAVLLCDVEKMPYEDIAKVMDCPVGTIRSRIFHARRTLRAALKDYAEETGVIRHGDVAVSKA